MKTICLAVLENGQLEEMLVKRAVNETTPDDLKEVLGTAVDGYFDQEASEDDDAD